jgi:hypothetical protein
VAKTYETIGERMAKFMLAQPVFFVATAPLAPDGHVNCSPKGNRGDFAVLGETRVAYQDMTGSGAETVAHLRENGRIVVMFCAFDGPPRIVRLHGKGTAIVREEEGFEALARHFAPHDGTRALVVVDVERISDSCGYGVPLMEFRTHRDNLDHWSQHKGDDGLRAYREEKNATSLDGLPAFGA